MTSWFGTRPERDDVAESRKTAQQIETWRNWKTFLQANETLLAIRRSESNPRQTEEVEQTAASPSVRRAAAEKRLKALPAALRARFDQRFTERQQRVRHELEAAQRPAGRHRVTVDADAVEQTALEQLLDEAEGRVLNAAGNLGWGYFPGTDDFYHVEIKSIYEQPDDASYDVGAETTDAAARRRSLRLIPVVLIVGTVLVYLTLPKTSASAASTSAQLTVGNAPAQTWRLTDAVGIDTSGTVTTYPLTEQRSAMWQRLRAPAGQWHPAAAYPVELCLPEAALTTLATLRVQGTGDTPERTYQVTTDPPAQPDLLLAACGAAAGTWSRYGSLQEILPLATHRLDETVALPGDVHLTLTDVAVLGPAQDPATPPSRVEIRLTVTASRGIAWNGVTTTLTPQGGDEVGPKVPRQVGTTTELSYLIPAFTTPTEVAWTVTVPGTPRSLRWRVPLEPPASHAERVRQDLAVGDVTATQRASDNTTVIAITLRNSGSTPLYLEPADLALAQGRKEVSLPAVPELQTALAVGEQRTVTVEVSGLQAAGQTVLTVGTERFAIEF